MSKKTGKLQVTSNSSDTEISSTDDSNEYPVQFDKFVGNTIMYLNLFVRY